MRLRERLMVLYMYHSLHIKILTPDYNRIGHIGSPELYQQDGQLRSWSQSHHRTRQSFAPKEISRSLYPQPGLLQTHSFKLLRLELAIIPQKLFQLPRSLIMALSMPPYKTRHFWGARLQLQQSLKRAKESNYPKASNSRGEALQFQQTAMFFGRKHHYHISLLLSKILPSAGQDLAHR